MAFLHDAAESIRRTAVAACVCNDVRCRPAMSLSRELIVAAWAGMVRSKCGACLPRFVLFGDMRDRHRLAFRAGHDNRIAFLKGCDISAGPDWCQLHKGRRATAGSRWSAICRIGGTGGSAACKERKGHGCAARPRQYFCYVAFHVSFFC